MTRSAADIGRGLAQARDARPIRQGERIHVIGVAGAGASAAALLAHHAGATVSGCDRGGPSPYTAALEAAGIPMDWQHSADHISAGGRQPPERLAVTKALTSIDPDHPELAAARALGIPIEPWQQVVADAAATTGQRLVAVAGTHGKSTTSGWLVDLLLRAGRDPSAFVGALLPASLTNGLPATARWGRGDTFVVEADEYAGNFDAYRPDLVLLLNSDWDHPDVFEDEAAVVNAFERWLRRVPEATVVANLEDPGVNEILEHLEGRPGRVSGFYEPLDLPIGLHGSANAFNATTVAFAGLELGIPEEAIRDSLANYVGVGRRMEVKGDVGGVVVIDDYGHHPTAIAKTLEAVRQRYPGRRVWAVYEPLTYHRTAKMLKQFVKVLATADEVAIADIWAGRDPDTTITSSEELASAVRARGGPDAKATGSVEATADYLAERVKPTDVVLVMGGGRSYVIAEQLVKRLKTAPPKPVAD